MLEPVVNLKKSTVQGGAASAGVPQSSAISQFQPITWETPEFVTTVKTRTWYGALFGIAAIIVLLMVWLQNYTAVVFFVLSAFMVYVYSKKLPRSLKFGVTGRGVLVGDRTYLYEDLRSFWIFYEKGVQSELSLQSNKMVMPYIHIPLGQTNPARVHVLLSQFLPEQKHENSAIDAISRSMGF